MAAPQQMEREDAGIQMVPVTPPAAPLLQGVTSIKFGPAGWDPHTHFQGQGSGPFGMAPKGLAGKTPMTDQDGKVLATLKFSTSNSGMGQLSAQLLLADGTLFAQFERSNRTKTMAMSENATTVSVNGMQYATVSYGASGHLTRADGSGGITFAYRTGCQDPSTKWCIVAFLCFCPTVGIGSCYAMHRTEKDGRLMDISSVSGTPPLQFAYATNPAYASVVVDFAQFSSLDERGKLDLVLLTACHVCSGHTEPGGGHSGHH